MKKKKTYGLLGRNITYSLSPIMHNAAFTYFGVNAEYLVFDRTEDELGAFFSKLTSGDIAGLNVTVPYKVIISDMLKKEENCTFDDIAENLGAVNTLKVEEGGIRAYNTDGKGFSEALREDTGFAPEGKKIFILGSGGASRAICFYLGSLSPRAKKIFVFDVDEEKTSSLVKDFKDYFGEALLEKIEEKEIPQKIAESSLVVNATPIGTKEGPSPVDNDLLHKDLAVYDLVYARETELVKEAKEKGLTASGGLGMLVNQAALAFEIWSEDNFYLGDIKKVMRSAFPEKLKRTYGWNT